MMQVRVRFAPSPTGFLHLGSARTALFNWLFARNSGGKFLLRIEDTDKVRSEKRFLDEIVEDLKWLGIDWDEEIVFQSQRFDIYRAKAQALIDAGLAYREGEAYIFKMEKGRVIEIDDMIHGKISVNTDEIKDQVMIKSDGSPAYNFCCVVDDIHLGITHIIRGDDHISNTPKQVLFYEAFGATPPRFGHMPLIMGADGAKLSKRHGGVSVEEYKSEGFLPEAMVNYLMLLGWYPGEEREIFTLEEAVKIYNVKGMSDVQAKFDIQKLKWMNGEYIVKRDVKRLLPLVKGILQARGFDLSGVDDGYISKLIEMYKVRMKTLAEFAALADCFFKDDYEVEEKGAKKHLDNESNKANLMIFAGELASLEEFKHEKIEAVCREIAEKRSLKAGDIIHPTRIAISGKTFGAGLFEMMEVLGKEKVIARMTRAAT
ncbi:MAG: glutamate--tRNA ligase [Candidatus Omnitrophica bacterium]|nr:glutamate--tRNA ligase [Candidatus Omnitrophota bacterium]